MCWKRLIASGAALVLGFVAPLHAQSEIDALVFDQWSQTKMARSAFRTLGYTWTWAASEGEFINTYRSKSWDLVVLELPHDDLTQKETIAQLLEDHVAAGGRLLVNFNNLDEWPRLQRLLGLDNAVERLVPADVPPLVPRHPSFAGFGLGVIRDPWPDSGDSLVPTSGSTIAGEFISGGAAIVVSNETKTIVNGFDWDSYGGTLSFAIFQIQYVMACRADFDQSTGAKVLDIFDFLEFQNAFVTQHPTANMEYDKAFDIFDFLAFQQAFVNGCD